MKSIRPVRNRRRGASAVEFGLLIALLAVAIVAAVGIAGRDVSAVLWLARNAMPHAAVPVPGGAEPVETPAGGDGDEQDTALPVLSVTAPGTVAEGAGSVTYTVSLDRPPAQAVTVDWQVAAGGSNPANLPADIYLGPIDVSSMEAYEAWLAGANRGTLTFVPGGSLVQALTFTLTDNDADEPDRTALFSVSAVTNAVLAGPADNPLTLADDDAPPVATLVLTGPEAFNENHPATSFRVEIVGRSSQATSIPLIVTGSATRGTDYTLRDAYGSGALSIDVAPYAYATLTDRYMWGIQDNVWEGDETVTVQLGTPTGATLSGPTRLDFTLTSFDGPPQVSIEPNQDTQVVEEGSSYTYRVSLSRRSSRDTHVSYSVDYSTAQGRLTADDYTLSPPGEVVVPAGALTADVTLTATIDAEAEAPEFGRIVIQTPPAGEAILSHNPAAGHGFFEIRDAAP